ncbi:MAG: sigma-70 family RNA polymerase sigma factor [Gammaproteobacteria bacterium]
MSVDPAIPDVATCPTSAGRWQAIDLHWAYAELLPGIRLSVGCRERAHDVLHDALLRTAIAHEAAPKEQPRAYLRTVVRTVLIDYHRDRGRWVEMPRSGNAPAHGAADARADHVPSAERVAELQESLDDAHRALEALPPRRREVFWMSRVEGYTCREIAGQLGLTLKTVQNHVMRVLVTLRDADEAAA